MEQKERNSLLVGELLIGIAAFWTFDIIVLTATIQTELHGLFFQLFIIDVPLFLAGILFIRKYIRCQRHKRQLRLLETILWKGHITDLARIGENMGITADEAADLAEEIAKENISQDKFMKVRRKEGYIQVHHYWGKVLQYKCPDCGAESWINISLDLVCPYCSSAIQYKR